MADRIAVLAQLDAAATTEETFYTVPALTQTTCSTLVVCNRTGAAKTFRVRIKVGGAANNDKQFIYYDRSVAANDSLMTVIGMTLGEADVMVTYASATGLSFTLFGVETS